MVAVLCRFGLRTFVDPTFTCSPSISLISSAVNGGGCRLDAFAGSSTSGTFSAADVTSEVDGVPLPAMTGSWAGSASVAPVASALCALANLFRNPSAETDIVRRQQVGGEFLQRKQASYCTIALEKTQR